MALRWQVKGLLLVQLPAALLLLRTFAAAADCLCQPSGCLCCVELNLTTSIDLGGPACLNVRQRERNVSLNMNYGDNPVHNVTIGLDNAADRPTCMNLLSDLAQICARFESMSRTPGSGQQVYSGCLVVEPALLGSPQATYPVGCFTFDQGQVRQVETAAVTSAAAGTRPEPGQSQEPEPEDESDEFDYQGLNAEELIAAVSASAEQGIALFSQWLGLNVSPKVNETAVPAQTEHENPAPAGPGAGRHGRVITLLADSEDKNDEKLKQLLGAQDNILKESARIGEPASGTAFLYSRPNAEEESARRREAAAAVTAGTISPENLAVVPSESRRGGRAYNIHQHVNEI